MILPLGIPTRYGRVAAVGRRDGERWYMMQKGNLTTLMPGDHWWQDDETVLRALKRKKWAWAAPRPATPERKERP